MKKKVIIAIVGATVGILAGLLVFININKGKEEIPVTDEVVVESVISKTGNTILDDEHTVAEFETDEYIENKDKTTEEAGYLEAGGISKVDEDDINYVAHKTEVLDDTVKRATSVVYAAAETNVYAEMSLESEILGSVDFNEKLTTYGIVDGWYVIDYNGRDGYIPEVFISSTKSKEQVKVEDITETTVIAQQSSTEKTETEIVDKDTNAGAIREEDDEDETEESTSTTSSTSSSSDNPAGLTDEQIAILDALENEYYSGPIAENGTAPSLSTPLTDEERELTKDIHWQ